MRWETPGVFVIDDLVAWLTGRPADVGYKRLSTLLRGSDQARALKEAVTAAVQVTVDEIGPSDREEAERIAEEINETFRRREPAPLPPGQRRSGGLLLGRQGARVSGADLDPVGQLVVVRRSSELTRSHPGMPLPRMFMSVALVVATRASDCAGSTRIMAPSRCWWLWACCRG
jgi:hypothetical protein